MRAYLQTVLIAICLIFSMTRADQVSITDELTKGGISLHITNAFLKTIKTQVIDAFIQSIKPQDWSTTGTYNLGLFKFTYNVTDLNMYQWDMDYVKSKIEFRADEPHLHLEFINYTMYMDFNYSLYADPKFYLDEGPAQVSFRFDNISIGLNIIIVDGVFQLQTNAVDAVYVDGNTYFMGQGDISYAMNAASFFLKSQLKEHTTDTVRGMVNQIVPIINGQLMAMGCNYNASGLLISWCAMENPKFGDDAASLIFRGEVRYDNNTPIPFEDKNQIPYRFEDGKDIQISVSDYFLNTTIYSAFYLGMLDYELTQISENQTLTAGSLKYIFSDILKYMNAEQPIAMRVVANKELIPYLEIVDGVTSAYALADISFSEVNGKERDEFLKITSRVNLTIDFEIQTPFTVMTDIKQFKFKASELALDKYQLTNIDDLNSIVGAISGFVRNFLNRELSGYHNHVFDLGIFKMDIGDTQLFERERYIWFDSRPQFYHKSTSEIEEMKARPQRPFESKPLTHEDQVNAIASILKLTPLYDSIQQMKNHENIYKNLAFANPGFAPNMGGVYEHVSQMPKERTPEHEETM